MVRKDAARRGQAYPLTTSRGRVTRKGALVALGFPFNAGDSVAQFQPLNVVEILKFGLSGLVFLFALLSFWLFYAEQKRDPPRPKMLGCILMFSLLNLVAASLVAVSGRFGVAAAPNALASGYALPSRLDSTGFAYSCDYSTFFIDMSSWKKLPPGVDKRTKKISSATFTRNDLLRKLSSSTDDYVLRPWTTGAGIETGFLRAPSGVELSFNEVSSDSERRTYEFVVPLGKQPVGASWPISTNFTIWNGFQGETQEDWRADIEVPTKFVSFTIRFPAEKEVTEAKVFIDDGRSQPSSLSKENPVVLSQDRNGQNFATWTGSSIPGKRYVLFVWKWQPRNNQPSQRSATNLAPRA